MRRRSYCGDRTCGGLDCSTCYGPGELCDECGAVLDSDECPACRVEGESDDNDDERDL